MLSIKNIWTIAKYETKTLLRSWFFRIFAGLALIVLTFLNIVFFAQAFEVMPWSFRAIPASVPYFNMMLLNLAQAVIAVFLASDFIKRDRKSNTTEVIYMRSMSNADYIFGKSLGLFFVFLGLNVLMLTIAAVINIVFMDVAFQFMPYLYYLLLISLPTLIFIFGLSFFVMSLVGNQAVTFLLLLGYFAISLVVLNYKFYTVFDSVGFFLPLAYSDFVGFSSLTSLLIQRLAYTSLGLGFIFVSVLMFKRLPQSKAMQRISRLLAVLFIGLGAALFTFFIINARSGEALRAEMREINDANMSTPAVQVEKYHLALDYLGDEIKIKAELAVKNSSSQEMSELIFTLNPGLRLLSIVVNGESAPFDRKLHLLKIKPAAPLAAGETATVKLNYKGGIDEEACYIAATKEERSNLNMVMFYKLGKRSAFLGNDYLLLTPEAAWYPLPGVGYGQGMIDPRQQQFSNYELSVKAPNNLMLISQGESVVENDRVIFRPETPLPQISLVAGEYTMRSIVVDSVTYSLYTHPRHQYFSEFTNAMSDTLESLIRELKNDYELKTKVDYPFDSFSIIETPIHFKPLSHPLSLRKDFVQPMQVLLPENAAYIDAADFKMNMKFSRDRLQDRNQSLSDEEIQVQVFRRFIESTFLGGFSFRRFGGPQSSNEQGSFSIFANFYAFRNSIQSTELPILNIALEAYLKGKVETSSSIRGFMRFRQAITDEEQAILALRGSSFQHVLNDPQKIEIAGNLLKAKSNHLFRLIESKVGKEKLEQYLLTTFAENQFKSLPANVFINNMEKELAVSMKEALEAWFNETSVPAFYITNFKNYKVLDGDRQRYQVIFTLYNVGEVDGVVVVDFFIPGGRRGFGRFSSGASDYERAVYVPAGRAKRMAIITDDQPRALTINTLVSKNLPSQIIRRIDDFEENNRAKPLNEERLLDEPPNLTTPDEYIVDNESDGFRVLTAVKRTPLQRLLKITDNEEEEYKPFSPWRAPQNWSKSINSLFYGDLVHSAYFVRAGNGDKKVAWEVDLPESGQYAVYAYGEPFPMRSRGRSFMKEFYFTVYHDDGEEVVEWSIESAQGWNYLGSYYFTAGKNKVELSDKSKGRLVIADAVKWVKK